MNTLAQQTCHHHPDRPAAAKCRKCGHFVCRECVTEYEGIMICGACLRAPEEVAPERKGLSLAWLSRGIAGLVGCLLAAIVFAVLGIFLARIPSNFDPRFPDPEPAESRNERALP